MKHFKYSGEAADSSWQKGTVAVEEPTANDDGDLWPSERRIDDLRATIRKDRRLFPDGED